MWIADRPFGALAAWQEACQPCQQQALSELQKWKLQDWMVLACILAVLAYIYGQLYEVIVTVREKGMSKLTGYVTIQQAPAVGLCLSALVCTCLQGMVADRHSCAGFIQTTLDAVKKLPGISHIVQREKLKMEVSVLKSVGSKCMSVTMPAASSTCSQ